MRKERLKIKKKFPFFFHLFAHSSLMIVYIQLNNLKVCWGTPPIKKSASRRNLLIVLHYKWIDWFPYETSSQCKMFPKKTLNRPRKSYVKQILCRKHIFCTVYTDTYLGSQSFSLKAVKDSFCFISRGTRSQILRLKYEMVSVPLNTNFTRGLLNSDW